MTTALLAARLVLLPTSVTWSPPAMPLAKLLEQMGPVTGRTYVCDAALKNEVVLVSVHEVSADELEMRLAAALGARWTHEKSSLRLAVDQDLDRKDRIDILNEAYNRIKAEIEKRVANAYKPFDPANTDPTKYKPGQISPVNGVFLKVLAKMSERDLRDCLGGKQQVYAWPTRSGFKPLPVDARETLGRLCSDVSDWVPYIRDPKSPMPYVNVPLLNIPDTSLNISSITGVTFKVNPDLNNRGLEAHMVLELKGSPRSGQAYFQITPQALPTSGPTIPTLSVKLTRASASLYEILQWLPVFGRGSSSQAQLYFEGIGGLNITFNQNGMPPTPVVDENDRKQFLHPEDNDPLSYFASEVVSTALNVDEHHVLAVLPDSLLGYSSRNTLDTSLVQSLIDNGEMALGTEGDWRVLAPKHPTRARDLRLDRALLGPALREADANGFLTIKTSSKLAPYFDKGGSPLTGLFKAVSGYVGTHGGWIESAPKYAVWNLVRPDQAPGILGSGSAVFSVVGNQLRTAAQAAALKSPLVPTGAKMRMHGGNGTHGFSWTVPANSPTMTQDELAVAGLPSNSTIEVRLERTPVYLVETKNPLDRIVVTLGEIAASQAMPELPNLATAVRLFNEPTGLLPLTQFGYTFKISCGRGVNAWFFLDDYAKSGENRVADIDHLPQATRDLISEYKKRLLVELKSVQSGLDFPSRNTGRTIKP